MAVVRDLLDSLYEQGFRRILIVNGHGGNSPASGLAPEFMRDHSDAQVLFHSWWNGPHVWPVVQAIDPDASHASWLESFPWTRVAGVEIPEGHKRPVDPSLRVADPATVRELLGDGCYGGDYARPDADWQAVWDAGVQEVRELIRSGWR
jgi:creatinine amidohydrolase